MYTFTKQSFLRALRFAKLLILIFLTNLSFTVKAQIGGSFDTEIPKYDFTDFKPLTAQKFIEKEFVFLKREYDKNPTTLIKGYWIEVIPSKRQGFRPSVSNHQVYRNLVDKSILEWAYNNHYDVLLDYGYNIVKKLENGTEVKIKIISNFSSPKFNKTIEQEFAINHRYIWHDKNSGWSVINSRIVTLHGLKSYEKETLFINGFKLIDACQKEINVLIQSGDTSNEKSVSLMKSYANHYVGDVELIRSKYGEVSGTIEFSRESRGIEGNLNPVKDMIESMLTFCDQKIAKAYTLFLEKNKTN